MRGAGALVRLAAALFFVIITTGTARAEGRWLRAETVHFVFYSDAPERKVREAAQSLETFDAVLRILQPTANPAPPNKLEVYLLRNGGALRTVMPDRPAGTLGVYNANPEMVAAFAVYRDTGAFTAQQVLFHEYAHHYMMQNFAGAYPAWFVEGFAELVQTATFEGDRALVGRYSTSRTEWLTRGAWLDIEDFLKSDEVSLGEAERERFYAQSWLAAHYLMFSQERMAGLGRYVAALRRGEDALASFEPSFGMSPGAFETALRAYVSEDIPLLSMPVPNGAASDVQITRLPDSANDLLLLSARMRHGVEEADRPALALEVDNIAARYPTDAFAQRVRARAAILRGARAAQVHTILDPVLAADPTDAEANFLIGLAYGADSEELEGEARAEAVRNARRAFTRAFRSNPNHAPTLYRYALTYEVEGAVMPASAVDVLLRAHELAPQVSEISVDAALVLMIEQRFEEAANLLGPIAYEPHQAGGAYVRRLLAAALNRQPPPSQ